VEFAEERYDTEEVERAVAEARRERDIEWCKMLGFVEAGGEGNTPEFIRKELDCIAKDEPEIALARREERERAHNECVRWIDYNFLGFKRFSQVAPALRDEMRRRRESKVMR
jgi:hypothetical protein